MNNLTNLTKLQIIELYACTRCGECANWCPAVDAYQDNKISPAEKIIKLRRILEGKDVENEEFAEAIFNCTTCGRCYEVCPVGIRCHELWPAVRARLLEKGYGPVEKIIELRETIEKLHNPFGLPMEDRNKWIDKDIFMEKAEIALFIGCELAYRVKPMAIGAVKVLKKSGIKFVLCDDEWCCGFPLYILGDRSDVLKKEIEHNIQIFERIGVKKVAPYCPCCYAIMKKVWKSFNGDRLPFEVVHILKIIADLVKDGKIKFKKPFYGKVVYHDPCYLSRGWEYGNNIIEEPREILRSIRGVELVELPESKKLSRCPGSGGGIRRANPDLSEKMAEQFFDMLRGVDFDVLLTSCPAVNERLNFIMEKKGYEIRVMDILEFASLHI